MSNKTNWLNSNVFAIDYCLCMTEQEAKNAFEEYGVLDEARFIDGDRADATVHMLDRGFNSAYIVCLKNMFDRDDIEVFGLLTHEAVHIVDDVFDKMDETQPGKEVRAYMTQTLSMVLQQEYLDRKQEQTANPFKASVWTN